MRETLVADASRSFQVHYLYTNLLGLEAGRSIYDGEIILGECGRISSSFRTFSRMNDGNLLIRDIDLDLARVAKLKNRSVLDSSTPEETDRIVAGLPVASLGKKSSEIPEVYLGSDPGSL